MYRVTYGIERNLDTYRRSPDRVVSALQRLEGQHPDWSELERVVKRMSPGSEISIQALNDILFVERVDSRTNDPRGTLQDRIAATNRITAVHIETFPMGMVRFRVTEVDSLGYRVEVGLFRRLRDAKRYAAQSYVLTPIKREYQDGDTWTIRPSTLDTYRW